MPVSRLRGLAGALAVSLVLLGGVLHPPAAQALPRIVGGIRASIDRYPWAVYLRTRSGFQYCGGSLVAPSAVVTAAHCVADRSPSDVVVVAGRQDTRSSRGTVARVTDIWVHPDFDAATFRNDVSVLTLARPVPYRPLPVATPADHELYDAGTSVLIVGWGATESGGPGSRYLRKATVPVGSEAFCTGAYGSQYHPRQMVCAGYRDGGVDTCQGDSGGPLVAGGKLIGITSFGRRCGRADSPGVYTRVATYSDLITAQASGS